VDDGARTASPSWRSGAICTRNDFTLQQHSLPFPILSDPGAAVAERFGIGYSVPEDHREYFRKILVNIPFVNSGSMYKTAAESSWRLPLPATFVVNRAGKITFSEAHADFRVRPEPADVLAALATSDL
jgi:peroxiredoxin